MAFDKNNLSALAYANAFTLWHYKSSDAATVIDGSGYFDAASNMLRVGDIMLVNAAGGDAVGETGAMTVLSNTGSVVDMSDLVSLSTTDSD